MEGSAGRRLEDKDLAAASKRAILVRMLHNLLNLSRNARDVDGSLRYLDAILTLSPEGAEERAMRALLRHQAGRRQEALEDVNWLLDHKPDGVDTERLLEFRRVLEGR